MERYLALIGGVSVCVVVMAKIRSKHKACTETGKKGCNNGEKNLILVCLDSMKRGRETEGARKEMGGLFTDMS